MIRNAKTNDIKMINHIGNGFNKNFSKLFHIDSEICNSHNIILVYDDENVIKGFIYAQDFGDNIDLLEIVVAKKWRQKKVGSMLIQFLIDNYCNNNSTITLEVSKDNLGAIMLYKKFGFEIVNIRKDYYGKSNDAYLMKRCNK